MVSMVVIAFIILILFFLTVAIIDGNRFHTVCYTVESEKLTEECSFVVLSDLHNKSYGKNNEALLETIEKLRPQGILIAGDILTARPEHPLDTALSLIEALSKHYPVYYGVGNHETRLRLYPEIYGDMGERYDRGLEKLSVRLMRNESVSLDKGNLRITGLDMERQFYKRLLKTKMELSYLEEALGKASEERFQILLAHNPDYFEEYAAWGADLVLSGHVHGGVCRLPLLGGVISPSLRLFPKYDGGRFQMGESTMILSRGLGSHTIPLRIFNPGELVFLTLKPKKKGEDPWQSM